MVLFIRGICGSGKSTIAKKIASKDNYIILEADMYFEITGKYYFVKAGLYQAHEWCYTTFCVLLNQNFRNVIVSNTFSQWWEIEKYIKFCEDHKIEYKILKATGEYENIHGCPQETINRMKVRWEHFEGEEEYK